VSHISLNLIKPYAAQPCLNKRKPMFTYEIKVLFARHRQAHIYKGRLECQEGPMNFT